MEHNYGGLDEIVRGLINEELDRRMREENKRAFIRESNPYEFGSREWCRWNLEQLYGDNYDRPKPETDTDVEVGRGWNHYCSALNGQGLVPEGFVRCGYCGVEKQPEPSEPCTDVEIGEIIDVEEDSFFGLTITARLNDGWVVRDGRVERA